MDAVDLGQAIEARRKALIFRSERFCHLNGGFKPLLRFGVVSIHLRRKGGAFSTLCNVAIIANKITSGNDVIFENVMLVARDPSASGDPEIQFGYTIELGTDVTMDHVFVASREKVSLQQGAVLGGAPTCGSEVSVQIIAMEDVIFQSDSIISNIQVGAGRDFNMQSNGVLNLTGVGSTIQALRDVIVATEGTFNDCPEEEEVGGEGEGEDPLPTPGEIVGYDNRLVH